MQHQYEELDIACVAPPEVARDGCSISQAFSDGRTDYDGHG